MSVSVFSHQQMDKLVQDAIVSPRLRVHSVLHNSHQDIVQRVIIALAEGTYIPPHYHELPHQWEQFQVMWGEVELLIFDDNGYLINSVVLGCKSGNFLVQIPPLTSHTLICRTASAVIMETKEGPFDERFAKLIPVWSRCEDFSTVSRQTIMEMMTNLLVGQQFCI